MLRLSASVAAALILAACSQKHEAAPAPEPPAAPAPEFRSSLTIKAVMADVIDPASWGVWNNQGWLIDKAGTHEQFPTTDAGWLAARSSAITLAEASNLLLLPGRPVDDDRRWIDNAHNLYDAAIEASKAAEAQNKQAFFDAGGRIYDVCTACHRHYIQGER